MESSNPKTIFRYLVGLYVLIFIGISIALYFIAPSSVFGETLTFGLKWTPSTSLDTAGYHIYCTKTSNQYPLVPLTTINSPFCSTILNIDVSENSPLYFVVTAFDFSGNESKPSKELIFNPLILNNFGKGKTK